MRLAGGCHCGAIRYLMTWPDDGGRLPARRCTCDYCTRFNGTWTSHPDARLEIEAADGRLRRYRFATRTADFVSCGACGVTVAALARDEARPGAVVNVNTLDDLDRLEFVRSDSRFDAESTMERLSRRAANWIGTVVLKESGKAVD